jgi:hypothetical protein
VSEDHLLVIVRDQERGTELAKTMLPSSDRGQSFLVGCSFLPTAGQPTQVKVIPTKNGFHFVRSFRISQLFFVGPI